MVMYEKEILRFHQAAALLPPEQRRALERLDDAVKARTEEIRLRAGQPVSLVLPEGEITLPGWERPFGRPNWPCCWRSPPRPRPTRRSPRCEAAFLPSGAGTAWASAEAVW